MSEGPRAVRLDEFDRMMELINKVFHSGRPPRMGQEYPHLFAQDNLQNLRIMVEDAKIVSHVGTTLRNAVIQGCSVRVGSVGAVCADPDYRGRGFAGACFSDACANARQQGVDFMLVSGDRSLYRRAGCRTVGLDSTFVVPRGVAAGPGRLTVERYSEGDLQELKRVYEAEPVRYLRPLEEWTRFIRDGKSTHHYAALWVVRRQGLLISYAALLPGGSNGTAAFEEYAGDRAALLAVSDQLMERNELSALKIHVQGHDTVMRSMMLDLGLPPAPSPAGGTQLIIAFSQFMDRLRPLMEERAGAAAASKLTFLEDDDRFYFRYDGDTVAETSRGGAAQFIWGTYEPQEWEWASKGSGKDVLESIFPVPALVYGFSYV